MSTSDPTLAIGDAALTADVEYGLDDLAEAEPPVAAPAAPAQAASTRDRVYVPGGIVAGEERAPTPLPIPPITPTPIPIPLKRAVSGRYRSTGATQLELRVDVDGRRPLRRASGDFYMQSGATLNYFGSFIVHAPVVTVTDQQVVVDGIGVFTWSPAYPRVRITIPRTSIFVPAAAATVRFLTPAGAPGASYTCPHASTFFRTVQFEEDRVANVTPFVSYNTGSLPAPPPARTLSVPGAFAEAGIEMQVAGVKNIVPTAGIGASWSNAELHAAMVANFSLWKEVPQWKVWMLTAVLHDLGPGLLGIMFDQQGLQRQGCAVFHASLAGTTAAKQREQLYTCVHELGHCFNLYHSFHKAYMNPPQPNRPNSLSWMNYPWYFPGGPAAFWSQFPFQFDDQELVHLRHAFRNHVIMGGDPFGTNAALENPEAYAAPVEDHSGLRLELRGRTTFDYGEPVLVELKLETLDLRGKEVAANLHPNFGFVNVAIKQPNGRVVAYRPMLEHCIIPGMVRLTRERPAVYESAYVGYGEDGLYFDAPGVYELRAVYSAPDGSRVASNTYALRVRAPLSREDDQVAELLLGEEQGKLFYLLGSDSPELARGNDALESVIEEHGDHPLAAYARLVTGTNSGRAFKTITRDGRIQVREPDYEESAAQLGMVVDAAIAGRALDNISLNQTMRALADVQEASGREQEAADTARRMLDHFRTQRLRPSVLEEIEQQVAGYEPGEAHLDAETRRARANHLDPSIG